jgi:glyoxalase family protein
MTKGIHHITAIAANAEKTLHFYTQILGLRLVKKTVNQDDTATYHLFFGDREGHPGMDLTFFIFQPAMQGHNGVGLVSKISFSVPEESLSFWTTRFQEAHVKVLQKIERFGKKRIVFTDDDSLTLELVGVPPAELEPDSELWTTSEVSTQHAIRCFYSATLAVVSLESIEPVLSHVFGYEQSASEERLHQYATNGSHRANLLEVLEEPSAAPGFNAAGTVHHIAFRATDEAEQLRMRKQVIQLGLYPTEVINRFYFKSVYFRTPAGILFEIATDGPGFAADEDSEHLGEKLSLPPFLEANRAQIEARLPVIGK